MSLNPVKAARFDCASSPCPPDRPSSSFSFSFSPPRPSGYTIQHKLEFTNYKPEFSNYRPEFGHYSAYK